MKKQGKLEKDETESGFVEDDAPPVLVREEAGDAFEEVVIAEEQAGFVEDASYVLGEECFVVDGVLYQKPAGGANNNHSEIGHGAAQSTNYSNSFSSAYNHQQQQQSGPTTTTTIASNINSSGKTFQSTTSTTGDSSILPSNSQSTSLLQTSTTIDPKINENNFMDENTHICCGLCGEIVSYESLINEHLPMFHPDVMSEEFLHLEEIPYDTWLTEKAQSDNNSRRRGGQGGSNNNYGGRFPPNSSLALHEQQPIMHSVRSTRTLRKISQIRVNINEMSLQELDTALSKKMVEKMGRKVPVKLVDKQHAKCGICGAIVSLNKKFEVVHLVRHFNAWHPSAHKCNGTWGKKEQMNNCLEGMKPLSSQDFIVIDTNIDAPDNLQCIWCGMFMDGNALAMHFHEIHPEEFEVPKCNLCLREVVVNARLTEKYGADFGVTMPDEHHFQCTKIELHQRYSSETALDKAIGKYQTKGPDSMNNMDEDEEEDDIDGLKAGVRKSSGHAAGDMACDAFSNSRMSFGRRSKPKRQFIQPSLRQAVPLNSLFVEALGDCHWRCKLCKRDIFAAVISAGAIRHFRVFHPPQLQNMQYELCKARLEKVSDGCMEFIGMELIECLECSMTFPLHRPFNMCRAIRHLKAKHPQKMPEYKNNENELQNKKAKNGRSTIFGSTMNSSLSSILGSGVGGIQSNSTAIDLEDANERMEKAALRERIQQENLGQQQQQHGVEEEEETEQNIMYASEILDPTELEKIRKQYQVSFDKAHTITCADIPNEIYVLTNEGEEIDEDSIRLITEQLHSSEPGDGPIVVQYSKAGQTSPMGGHHQEDEDQEEELNHQQHSEDNQMGGEYFEEDDDDENDIMNDEKHQQQQQQQVGRLI